MGLILVCIFGDFFLAWFSMNTFSVLETLGAYISLQAFKYFRINIPRPFCISLVYVTCLDNLYLRWNIYLGNTKQKKMIKKSLVMVLHAKTEATIVALLISQKKDK